MASVYKTKSGDVWDGIAKEVYGDESCASFLMANNQKYLEYFVFPEGISLTVEDLPEDESTLPDWRR
ncbi:MAG: phage tail protein [Lachnospiraceae bacterium]|nr:phage tail protein [Lachnospiraceae bacterium]